MIKKNQQVLIIAEAGVNHNGDRGMAFSLVDAAAEAGADYVKFQTFQASGLVSFNAPKAEYQLRSTDAGQSQYEMLKQLELSREMHEELISRCRAKRIDFMSTAFDPASLDLLLALGIGIIKIPSGDLTNLPMLRRIGGIGIPVILSTGMANLGEIEAAIDILERSGLVRSQITVMHCSTEYPAPISEVNLKAMCAIREAFGVAVGYSDHTAGIEIAVAAVAMGATVIEKHFTLDRNLPGPDHRASLEPKELKEMVTAIRNVELALGDGIKRPGPSEIRNIKVARKSLVASQPIKAGEKFSFKNLTAKRPGTGVSPMRWDEVIGRVAKRDFAADELIEL